MHALEVIIIRDAEAIGRAAAHAEIDGDHKLATALINARPRPDKPDFPEVIVDEANRAFWRANTAALKAEGRE